MSLFWQLPASVRSLAAPACRRYSVTARQAREPLDILFCGSDAFSVKSLDAICEARREVPGLIGRIEVVHRPAKRTGRGMKVLTEVPIHTHATALNLPTHPLDTFTKWTPDFPISLTVAVSFGLLIPPRILDISRYGGINLHPSLLPDLRGPAPIEHTILRRRTCTGVSVQTLHPTQFDRGVVLAQTPAPGIDITRDTTAETLEERLAGVGAEMLVDVLKKGLYAAPHEGVASWHEGPIDHAPKLTKQDRYVSFVDHALEDVLAIQRALGDMWCVLPDGERLIMHRVAGAGKDEHLLDKKEPGLWKQEGSKEPLFKAKCGGVGKILASTYAGGKKGLGNAKVMRLLSDVGRLCE